MHGGCRHRARRGAAHARDCFRPVQVRLRRRRDGLEDRQSPLSQAEIPKTYDPKAVEARIYEEWERSGAFEADPNPEKKPYCIVLPPPNVTGALHMGHALNGASQDTLVRRARMKGYEALWLPGVDHASIGLHNVVERKLMREEGKTRFDIGRERFVELCREFAEESRGQILGQLRKLGASVDWRRLRYTMDDG